MLSSLKQNEKNIMNMAGANELQRLFHLYVLFYLLLSISKINAANK